jgi:hypothetical protein
MEDLVTFMLLVKWHDASLLLETKIRMGVDCAKGDSIHIRKVAMYIMGFIPPLRKEVIL